MKDHSPNHPEITRKTTWRKLFLESWNLLFIRKLSKIVFSGILNSFAKSISLFFRSSTFNHLTSDLLLNHNGRPYQPLRIRCLKRFNGMVAKLPSVSRDKLNVHRRTPKPFHLIRKSEENHGAITTEPIRVKGRLGRCPYCLRKMSIKKFRRHKWKCEIEYMQLKKELEALEKISKEKGLGS